MLFYNKQVLNSGIELLFCKNTKLENFFEEVIDYDSEHHQKIPFGYYFLLVRGLEEKTANYLCKPSVELIKALSDKIDLSNIKFQLQYSTKRAAFLLVKHNNKYQTLWLSELKI